MDSEKKDLAKRDPVEQKWWWGWAAAMSIISEAVDDKVAESKEQWTRQGWDAAQAARNWDAALPTSEEETAEVYFVDEEEKTAALEFEKGLMRKRDQQTQDPVESALWRGFKSGMSICGEKVEEEVEEHRQRCFRAGWAAAMAARAAAAAAAAAKATGDSAVPHR